jgi:hypothetical protein
MKKIHGLIIIVICSLFFLCRPDNPLSGTITEIECKTLDKVTENKGNRHLPGDEGDGPRIDVDNTIDSPTKDSLGDY